MLADVFLLPNRNGTPCEKPNNVGIGQDIGWMQRLAVLLFALLTTSASLGIATYAGWQRGGMPVERAMNIVLGGVAVLYVHLLPVAWNALRSRARISALSLWSLSLVVVLYGQASFFIVSQQNAGDLRAQAIPVSMPLLSSTPAVRSRTAIARDAAKARSDLARTEIHHCISDCPALRVRKMTLAAQLGALDTEAEEARRREVEDDRRNKLIDRNEQLRATLRADPVASRVAGVLGTTEGLLELALGIACAVVLEGAAIVGWLLVSSVPSNTRIRKAVARGRDAADLRCPQDAPGRVLTTDARTTLAADHTDVALARETPAIVSAIALTSSEESRLLNRIHEAVASGQLKPTQASIRKFLCCGQPKAGDLNRKYHAHFGTPRNRLPLESCWEGTPERPYPTPPSERIMKHPQVGTM